MLCDGDRGRVKVFLIKQKSLTLRLVWIAKSAMKRSQTFLLNPNPCINNMGFSFSCGYTVGVTHLYDIVTGS